VSRCGSRVGIMGARLDLCRPVMSDGYEDTGVMGAWRYGLIREDLGLVLVMVMVMVFFCACKYALVARFLIPSKV
jgi:hypothetical protein